MPRLAPLVALLAAVVVALAGAACGEDDAPGPEDLEVELPVGARVEVDESGVTPRTVTVTAGEIVEFTNTGEEEHRLVAEGSLFDTGAMLPGETFAFLAEEPGRIEYRDGRPGGDGPTGSVVVEPAEP